MNADEREDLLSRLLAGELRPDSDEAQAAMRADPSLQEEYELLRDLEADYRRIAASERRDIERAAADRTPVDTRVIADTVREFARTAAPTAAAVSPPPGTRRWWLLAAAGAILALGIGYRLTRPRPPELPPLLGQPTAAGLLPNGDVADFAEFSWTCAIPDGARVSIAVFDDAGKELFTSDPAQSLTSPWRPGTLADGWPRTIRWELRIEGVDGIPITHEARATRR